MSEKEINSIHDHGHMHDHDHGHTHDHDHGHTHTHDHEHIHDYTHDHEEHGRLNELPHRHVLEDGTVVEHAHTHGHTHTHQNTKSVINRLARAIGHLESVKRMVEDGRDCSEVLVQLAAVKSALNNTGKVILQDHIAHCIVDAVASGDDAVLEDLNKAISQFIK